MARSGDDDLWASLGRRPDDEQAAASARARSQRRWLQQLAAESTTLAGVLLTLAECDAPVTLRCGPWAHEGQLRTVTAALVTLEGRDGLALLPTESITVVNAAVAVADDRMPGAGADLASFLASLVPERPPLRLLLADGTEVAGRLMEVGKNVVLVALASSVATVRLSAVAGCILPERSTRRPA